MISLFNRDSFLKLNPVISAGQKFNPEVSPDPTSGIQHGKSKLPPSLDQHRFHIFPGTNQASGKRCPDVDAIRITIQIALQSANIYRSVLLIPVNAALSPVNR